MSHPSEEFVGLVLTDLQIASALSIIVVGLAALWAGATYNLDIVPTHQAIRRNYQMFGRYHDLFEHLGGFFRQFFFAMDREELPFNQAQRSWFLQASEHLNNAMVFGSTQDSNHPGRVLFVNRAVATLIELHPKPPLPQHRSA